MIAIKQKHKNNKNVLNNNKTPRLKHNPPQINKILKDNLHTNENPLQTVNLSERNI